ncbi:hypothetical protein [Deinococcus sp. S9]|uniref:hypothetical protein n=1 Tax=Deinococcus sp. S9 TaxID=2545754 RepID=UPI0010542F61|nr:hypothetical protein [Deinococcus sp. S9]TDE84828.1 hypothetical protein E0686_15090 [Deinococcus sp. S9]
MSPPARTLPPLLHLALVALILLAVTRVYVVLGPPGDLHAASIQLANLCRAAALLLAQGHLHLPSACRLPDSGKGRHRPCAWPWSS